ncbi:CHAT domain-containing tetratricopeptide repeat protein [Planktothrix sp. FACHB-1365]|uniref:CHAT domain-containing protein n=1 Tax=Planktothrix sp. FACHB-1365 TaxID=2692855 RepID=UPI0016827517|nr:CHAT domain-containing tetratricopeptide repeat protein [Planktothrix sp. FACHB-1365]MBD2485194.1 CHAT domain-containing protein [Planktothrix sp. FACHB-1365]
MKLQHLGLTTLFTLLTTLTLTEHPSLFFWESLQIGNGVFAQTVTEQKAEADRLLDQGVQQFESSQHQAAIQSWEMALKIYHEIGDRKGEGNTLNSFGIAYNRLGQYQKAIEVYQQSLTIRREIGDHNGEWSSLMGLGNTYLNLGQYQKAIDFSRQSLTISREIGNRFGEGNAQVNLGIAYWYLGQYQKAIEFYQQSLTISREIGDRDGEGRDLNNLGAAYNSLGQYQKAIEFYQQSLTIKREIGNRFGEGRTLHNLGAAYDSLGQYQKAIEFYQKSLAITRGIGDRNGEGYSLNSLGWTLFKLGNLPEAEKHLFASLEVKESLRQDIKDDLNKVSLSETQRSTYNTLQEVLIAQNKINQALEVSERGRGRALAELLAQQFTSDSNQFSPVVSLAQLKKIAQQQKATIVEYSIVGDDFSIEGKPQSQESELYIWVIKPTGEVEFRRSDLKPLWQQQNTDLSRLIFAARCFDNDACKSDFTVASARGELTRTQTRSSGLFNVNADARVQAQNIPIPSSSKNPEFQQLYQLLIQPIADLLPTNPDERVIFIPTDSLFYLPFAALQDETGKYLIEKHTIVVSPSIAVLESTHQKRQNLSNSASDILIIGNPQMPKIAPSPGKEPMALKPLPFAEKEAISIGELLKIQPLIGANATESTVLNRLENARIIHFATHGIFDNIQPLNSGIALTPSGSEDGLLTADQIFGLKLNAELIVLSACDTGLGEITGDGVIGLSRSFLSAGVPSLVVSLWSVDDQATGELMTQFYQNLQTTKDKAQALKQAMLTVKKTNPNPYYWSAFMLMGEAL